MTTTAPAPQPAWRPVAATTGAPVRRTAFWLSVALVAVASSTAASTLFADVLRGPAATDAQARGTALVVLAVAVPTLALSMVAAARGSVVAVMTWLGVTAYLLYNAVMFLFATPFNSLFLLDVALLSLALWSIVALLVGIDARAFADRVTGLPHRAVAAYVGVVVVLNTLLWLGGIIPAMRSDGKPAFLAGTGVTTNPVYVQDLAVWLPLMGIAAVWLWRRRPWGYLITGPVLVMWLIEAVTVASDQWFGHAADPASPVASAAMVPAFLALAGIGAVPVAAFVRALHRGGAAAG